MSYNHSDYTIQMEGGHALFTIKRKGSGPVPKQLRGGYTTIDLAKQHINSYDRGKANANKKRTSTD